MVVPVALTGATGFLGLRLLRQLLGANRSVTVLAHAGSGDALHRITRFLELTGAPEPLVAELPARIRVVETDLERPRLGLSAPAFHELADGLGAIWHSAGSINLEGDLPQLRRTNVDGTRRVLELAAAGRRKPVVHHVSTAFVAGARRDGVAYEDELDDASGFENAYERSKYEAEKLVHAWSREHGRPVVVLRPSILVTDLPPHPDLPSHPLQVIERILSDVRRTAGPEHEGSEHEGSEHEGPQHEGPQHADPAARHPHGPGPGPDRRRLRTTVPRPRIRLVGQPDGRLNLTQVEHAAEVMVRLAGRTPSGGVDTYHVVHDRDVPVRTVVSLLEGLAGISIDLVAGKPDAPSALEALLDFYPGMTAYLGHRRRFDDTRVRTLLGPSAVSAPVDLGYLWSGLGPEEPVPAPTPPPASPTAVPSDRYA
ncbi:MULTISPECIES: SDR family oxidoreductase [Streptomyces]|uniref:SDR family oxidoreductase n=1 Tax=Streptomyces TaxID=1883 RepID=UPI000B886EE3|nr:MULTISPECIES: SDR family oxidoreductase [unclassified Streptomyces]MYQ53277.1 NAD-dependent epimerase/dehydratase family protein [Streptomyces sp. SID4941]